MVFAILLVGIAALMWHSKGKGPGVGSWVLAWWWGPSVLTGSLCFKYKKLLGEQSQDCMTLSPVLLSLQRKVPVPRKRKSLPRSHTPSERLIQDKNLDLFHAPTPQVALAL